MSARDVALEFNDAINRRDLDALVALMTDDYRFVDSTGATFDGRARGREIWKGFFAAFPDYTNHFETVVERGDVVTVAGRSSCKDARLAGPALVHNDQRRSDRRVARHKDTPGRRRELGLDVTDG